MDLPKIMQSTFSADYEPAKSPAEVVEHADISISGRLVSVEEGRSVSLDGDVPDHYVVFGLQVEQKIKEDPTRDGKLVYFELFRPDNLGPEVFAKAAPLGAEFTLIGHRVDESHGLVEDQFAGREPGATLYDPDIQGLFIESDSEAFQSVLEPLDEMKKAWRGIDSMRELVAMMN